MDIEKYKTTSFLANISDEEIIKILNKCGYRVYYEIEEETDGARKPIERIYDPKTKKVYLEISCKNVSLESFTSHISAKLGFGALIDFNSYNISLIMVNDYVMQDIMPNSMDEKQLQDTFAKFMYNKFGEQYRLRYNRYHTRRNKKIDEEKERI